MTTKPYVTNIYQMAALTTTSRKAPISDIISLVNSLYSDIDEFKGSANEVDAKLALNHIADYAREQLNLFSRVNVVTAYRSSTKKQGKHHFELSDSMRVGTHEFLAYDLLCSPRSEFDDITDPIGVRKKNKVGADCKHCLIKALVLIGEKTADQTNKLEAEEEGKKYANQ